MEGKEGGVGVVGLKLEAITTAVGSVEPGWLLWGLGLQEEGRSRVHGVQQQLRYQELLLLEALSAAQEAPVVKHVDGLGVQNPVVALAWDLEES